MPQLVDAIGIGVGTASEMLIVAGDNIDRVRSEPAWARLCGVAPIPASSGMTNRHRLNGGGHRQANATLYRAVIVRMRFHQPPIAYVTRRTTEGTEIIRCPKRLLARKIVGPPTTVTQLVPQHRTGRLTTIGASTRSLRRSSPP